jgi:hypothetical protein
MFGTFLIRIRLGSSFDGRLASDLGVTGIERAKMQEKTAEHRY